MYAPITDLLAVKEPITLLLNNGFEPRAPRAAELLRTIGLSVRRAIVVKYPGKEHQPNEVKIAALARQLIISPTSYSEVPSDDVTTLAALLDSLDPEVDRVVCDITGLSRYLILRILSLIYRRRLKCSLIYTEAKEYYPRHKEFRSLLKIPNPSDAFTRLTEYEAAEIVYSSNCHVEEIPELPGRVFPNHAVKLVAFLAFKRSRLSAILNQYETNARVFIHSVPVRDDLKWRERALEIINFDLVQENKGSIIKLHTLNWQDTHTCLSGLYSRDLTQYRFNVILAPLGSKMQTVGAWYFAVRNPEVKVVTSTPKTLFPGKYSVGYTDTHLVSIDSMPSSHED